MEKEKILWKSRELKEKKGVIVREDFSQETEKDRRILMPIMYAAKAMDMKAWVNGNKLFIEKKPYTVDSLHMLPECVKPEKIATRELEEDIFFFSDKSIFSHFAECSFQYRGHDMKYGETAIQLEKARLFKDHEMEKKILDSKTPGEAKKWGKKIDKFDRNIWISQIPNICYMVNKEKFSQDQRCKAALLSTGTKALHEAAPRDIDFGIGMPMWTKDILSKKSRWGNDNLGKSLCQIREEMK